MGLSVVAAHTVFAAAILLWGTMLLGAEDASQDAIAQAEREAAKRRQESVLGDVSFIGQSYTPGLGIWTLTLQNTGDRAIDAAELDILADGVFVTDKVTLIVVDGGTGTLWPPGYEAVITLTDVKPRPDRLAMADEYGQRYVEVV